MARLIEAAMLGLALLALDACDKAKPRHLPPDPFATPPGAFAQAAAPAEAMAARAAASGPVDRVST